MVNVLLNAHQVNTRMLLTTLVIIVMTHVKNVSEEKQTNVLNVMVNYTFT